MGDLDRSLVVEKENHNARWPTEKIQNKKCKHKKQNDLHPPVKTKKNFH